MVWLLLSTMFFATLGFTIASGPTMGVAWKIQQRGSAKHFRFCAGIVFFGLCQRDLGPNGSEPSYADRSGQYLRTCV
jgi:hypothetical protein